MGERILLADDEEGIRKVVGLTLRDLGHAVTTAADGAEALRLFRTERPSLVVTDVRMPGMDGLALLRAIKAESPDTEVIIVTGHGDMDLAIEGLKYEAADFIAKPIHAEALEIAVRRASEKIDIRRRMREYTHNLEELAQRQAERIVEMERSSAARQAAEGMAGALCGLADDLKDEQSLFNEMPCFVSIITKDGVIASVNPLYREKLGDKTGRPCREAYLDGEARGTELPALLTITEGKAARVRETYLGLDGTEIPVMVHTAPIRGASGAVELVMEIAADLGEVKRLQEQLSTAQDRLAQLGMLMAQLSHDIKGLLTAADGAVYKVDAGLLKGDPERLAQGWSSVKTFFTRIKTLVLDILLCAKKREPELTLTDLSAFAASVAAIGEPKAASRGVRFLGQWDEAMGMFAADAGLLSAALVNLIENAVDACASDAARSEHQVAFTVQRQEAGAEEGGAKIVFSVADNGTGMDPETQRKVFQVFFSTKGSQGTGLGLFIAKHAVAGHGGEIKVESAPGQGTTISVLLPACNRSSSTPTTSV